MTINDPDHKVTARLLDAAAGAARRRRRGGPDRRRPGRRRAPPSPTSPTGVEVDGATVAPAVRISAIGDREDAGRRDGDPRWHHRDRPPARRDGPVAAGRRASAIDALQTPRRRLSYARPGTGRRPTRVTTVRPAHPTRSSMSELDYPAGPALHRRARVGARPATTASCAWASPPSPRTPSATSSTSASGRRRHASPRATPAARSSRPSRSATSTRPCRRRGHRRQRRARRAAPELVNSDPYGEGWMYELRLADAGCPGRAPGRRAPTGPSSADVLAARPHTRGARWGTMAVQVAVTSSSPHLGL